MKFSSKLIQILCSSIISIPLQSLAGLGDPLWRYYAEFGVTVIAPIQDLTGNGGVDLLIGSEDDSLYMVEGKGSKAGSRIWARKFNATISAVASVPDLDGDNHADVVAGDQFGLIGCYSGAKGDTLWRALSFGTVLSIAAMPDENGDGAPDVAIASENDTVYLFSGKPGGRLGKAIWTFGASGGKPKGQPKLSAAPPPKDGPAGANALSLLIGKSGVACLAVGTSADTVYCLNTSDGKPKWKTGLPGDIWKTTAFPDQDGDGVEDLLLACGADAGYLLSGSTGAVIWSHAVSLGATAVAAAPDMDGDGKPDALIGDGNGTVHCVPGVSKGAGVKAAWTYAFGDTSTILSIAVPGDLDKDGRADCAVGTSNDTVALISGKGARLFAAGLGGQVHAVAATGDIDGNGSPDWIAGTEMGFAQAHSGGGTSVIVRHPGMRRGPNLKPSQGSLILFAAPSRPLRAYDGTGRQSAMAR